MTQRRRTSKAKAKRRFGRRAFLAGAGAAACVAAGWYLRQKSDADRTAATGQDTPPAPNPALPAGEWRAVWVSYLDWALLDFSTEDTFRAGAAQLLDNCAGLGLNTVLAQVRPFGDALYRSSLFPWSHLCTGVQGKDPGFDPLDVFLTEAHRRGIGVEAWVNPYRLRSSAAMPPNLAENNLANTHPDWLCTAGEGLYLNPAVPAAADYVVQGVAELLQNYPVDGIHFDDYFYPHHRCRRGRGAVYGKRRSRPCRVAAAERYRAGGESVPHREGGRPDPAVRHQSAGQPGQRP